MKLGNTQSIHVCQRQTVKHTGLPCMGFPTRNHWVPRPVLYQLQIHMHMCVDMHVHIGREQVCACAISVAQVQASDTDGSVCQHLTRNAQSPRSDHTRQTMSHGWITRWQLWCGFRNALRANLKTAMSLSHRGLPTIASRSVGSTLRSKPFLNSVIICTCTSTLECIAVSYTHILISLLYSLCVCVYAYAHTHTHTVHICMGMYTYPYIYPYIYVHIYTYTLYVYVWVWLVWVGLLCMWK